MPERHLYEYAIIRVVPDIEREEFVNVGVILYCKSKRYLKLKTQLSSDRLRMLSSECDVELIESYLLSFSKIAEGGVAAGAIGLLDFPSRFRWMTAVKSSMLQTSRVHCGLSADLDATLEDLFCRLVL